MSGPNPSYKPSEGKREEFRKYLEKNGVMDALTRVLVNLYEEVDKPEDALEYIRDRLAIIAGVQTYKQMQSKLEESEEKIKDLEAQLQLAADSNGAEAPAESSEEQPAKTEESDDLPVEEADNPPEA